MNKSVLENLVMHIDSYWPHGLVVHYYIFNQWQIDLKHWTNRIKYIILSSIKVVVLNESLNVAWSGNSLNSINRII